MSDIGKKVIGFVSQLVLLPMYAITWVLGSPYLMTLLCIMSEVLVELVVSAVMAGVSLVVSAVILMEDDNRPLTGEQAVGFTKMLDNSVGGQKIKSTSTKSLERVLAAEVEKGRTEHDAQTSQNSLDDCIPKRGSSGGSPNKGASNSSVKEE